MQITPPTFLSQPLTVHKAPPVDRPIDPNWTCQHSGECCTLPAEVVMTREEWEMLKPSIPLGVDVVFRDVNEKFIALKAQPCPLHIFNRCTVYEVRPYNCRRFGCMRPDPKTEVFELGGPLGCKNLSERVEKSRDARRQAIRMQHKAQRWGRKHGWENL